MARPTRPEHELSDQDGPPGLVAGNHRIKRLRRLVTQRKARSEERAFVVEGPALVAEALAAPDDAPFDVEAVFVEHDPSDTVVFRADARGVPVHQVASGVLTAVLDTMSPQPVAAIVSRAPVGLDRLADGGLVLIVIDPRDPGNLGTLIRSAEAAGGAGMVLAGSAVDPTNPKVVRAAAGAALRLPIVVRPDTMTVLDELASAGRTLLATVIDDRARPYDEVDWDGTAAMLGNEAHGLAPEIVARADGTVTIPLAGPTESLNLGVAGSLLCFEALRQQRAGTEAR